LIVMPTAGGISRRDGVLVRECIDAVLPTRRVSPARRRLLRSQRDFSLRLEMTPSGDWQGQHPDLRKGAKAMADPVVGLPRAGPEERLRAQVRRLRCDRENDKEGDGVDLRPANAYEAVTRQMVEDIAADVREIKGRLNNLLFMIVAAVLLDIIARMLGA
jgi:hypothetical protein